VPGRWPSRNGEKTLEDCTVSWITIVPRLHSRPQAAKNSRSARAMGSFQVYL
jgi:hypothetical protein